MFSAGFSVGSVVEISASMDHENGCLTQAASVSQAAFLAYYYYDMWQAPIVDQGTADSLNFVYSSIYAGKLVDALNAGGCYKFDINMKEIQDYVEP